MARGLMSKIPHEDERIIEILTMFAAEIKSGRVREGEAIDKAACVLTAYMAGVVDAVYILKTCTHTKYHACGGRLL